MLCTVNYKSFPLISGNPRVVVKKRDWILILIPILNQKTQKSTNHQKAESMAE